MSDDDDLFEREMASLGLRPDSKVIRDRDRALFDAAVASSGREEQTSTDSPGGPAVGSSGPPVETEDEAARIFAEAMGSLWKGGGEDPETFETTDELEPGLPEGDTASALQSRSPVESDTEAGRIFEAALNDLVGAPPKEGDQGSEPAPRDLWAEPTEVLKRSIRRGTLRHTSELDLHGMTQREARGAVASYLANSAGGGTRFVRIVCGRGLHSRAGSVLLRDTLPTWLQVDFQELVVRAFQAPRSQGGEGAWYAVLRER